MATERTTDEHPNKDFYDHPERQSFEQPLRSCKNISLEARQRNRWIYDPRAKEWFSPEEFLEKFGRITHGNQDFLDQVQIKDPAEGIKAGHQTLLGVQIKLEYYQAGC